MKKFILLTNADPETPGNAVVNTEIISSICDGEEEAVIAEVKESAAEIYSMLQ